MPETFDCQACGACCHSEVLLEVGDVVPLNMTDGRRMLCGVGGKRCIGLRGVIGDRVRCALYENRPAICRRVTVGDPFCLFSRNFFGLPGGEASDVVVADILNHWIHKR